jgi:hypothetical protein
MTIPNIASPEPETDRGPDDTAGLPYEQPDPVPADAGQELDDFRQALRHRLRQLIIDDRFPIGDANRLLTALDETPLRRLWTVDVTMTFRCDVTASSAHDATEAAEILVANALDDAGPLPLELLWESRSCGDPVPGDFDRNDP